MFIEFLRLKVRTFLVVDIFLNAFYIFVLFIYNAWNLL